MVKQSEPTGSAGPDQSSLNITIRDSAQQIWLAGLGAFTQAQAEGSKVFDALVKEGAAMQRRTQAVAEEKLTEAGHKMSHLASDFEHRANDLQAKVSGQWDKLEHMFEDRVTKVLQRLGVPSAQEIEALSRRVDELSAVMKKPAAKPPVRRVVSKTARKTAAKKPAAPRKP